MRKFMLPIVFLTAAPGLLASLPGLAAGRGGTATLSPTSLTFNATVTATSSAQAVTLANSSGEPITVQSLPVGTRFEIAPGGTCAAPPFVLADGQSCTVNLRFSSANVGSGFTGSLTPGTSPPGAFTPASVSLSGNATPAALNLAPAALTFDATVTANSPPQPVTVSNASDVAITVSSQSASTRFTIVPGGTCATPPYALAPGQSCTVNLRFSSTNVGTGFTGALTTITNPTTEQTPASVSLSGNATPAALNLAPAALTFNATVTANSPPQPVTVSNASDVAITVTSQSASTRFAIVAGGSCAAAPFVLAPGQSCTVNLRFSSTNVGTGFTGALTTITNPTTEQTPASVTLTGNATPIRALLEPAGLDFGATVATTTSAPLLLGIGNADAGTTLPIDSLQFTSPRFLRVPGGSCPANLPFNVLGGASCTLAIAFQPIAFAASSGALTFSSTGSVAEFDPASVALDGIGIPEPPLFIDGFE